jgi:predicted site-specific integrase-resolvase
MEQDRYVNDVEAAMILSVSPQTLRNYRHVGKGPAYSKRGRMVRYRVADLLEFMKAGRVNPQAPQEAVLA